jgi:hypothetical protein
MESFDSIGETDPTEFLTTAQGHRTIDDLLYEINAFKVMLACACSKGNQECTTRTLATELSTCP